MTFTVKGSGTYPEVREVDPYNAGRLASNVAPGAGESVGVSVGDAVGAAVIGAVGASVGASLAGTAVRGALVIGAAVGALDCRGRRVRPGATATLGLATPVSPGDVPALPTPTDGAGPTVTQPATVRLAIRVMAAMSDERERMEAPPL